MDVCEQVNVFSAYLHSCPGLKYSFNKHRSLATFHVTSKIIVDLMLRLQKLLFFGMDVEFSIIKAAGVWPFLIEMGRSLCGRNVESPRISSSVHIMFFLVSAKLHLILCWWNLRFTMKKIIFPEDHFLESKR